MKTLLSLLAVGFLMVALLRLTRVLRVRFRGGTHPRTDIDFVGVNVLVGTLLAALSGACA